jgi:hypothetical protein
MDRWMRRTDLSPPAPSLCCALGLLATLVAGCPDMPTPSAGSEPGMPAEPGELAGDEGEPGVRAAPEPVPTASITAGPRPTPPAAVALPTAPAAPPTAATATAARLEPAPSAPPSATSLPVARPAPPVMELARPASRPAPVATKPGGSELRLVTRPMVCTKRACPPESPCCNTCGPGPWTVERSDPRMPQPKLAGLELPSPRCNDCGCEYALMARGTWRGDTFTVESLRKVPTPTGTKAPNTAPIDPRKMRGPRQGP